VFRRLVVVAFFIEVGLLLLVLPWSAFWEHNYFAEAWPPLRPFMTNNFLRGAITGLGLVNLGAGFLDLARVFSARGRGTDVTVPDGTPRT
jgi:polyferredoxin